MWWENLNNLQQVAFIIASVATAIMIIFIIMMLVGMTGAESFDGGVEADFDGSAAFDDIGGHDVDVYNSDSLFSIAGLRILSIRSMLAFFSIGGWVVYILGDVMNPWGAFIIGLLSGAFAAVVVALIMKAIMNLESSGNLDYRTAVGKTAKVYIRIPKDSFGKGKVIFNHQGRLVEVDAITKEKEDILAKKEVKIVGLEDETTLVVKNIEEE